MGGSGDDELKGGSGYDVLIGGTGGDTLKGKGNDDILIAGTTDHDDDFDALCAIMQGWSSGGSYSARTGALAALLNANTVHDDGEEDDLWGGDGRDWFFAKVDGPRNRRDTLHDRKSNETLVQL